MKARKELTREVATRYRGASRKEKGVILNEFVSSTGHNRSYAALILLQYGKTVSGDQIPIRTVSDTMEEPSTASAASH